MSTIAGLVANTQESDWTIPYFWHQMNWLLRADLLVLGLLFAYTVALVFRISRQYKTVPCGAVVIGRTRRQLAAELNIRARNLESIATTAPYLGLIGTCLGIINTFFGFAMEKRAAIGVLSSELAGALVPAAAGILVAIATTCGHQYACTRLDMLGSELPRRKNALMGRFTLPSFGIIAAYVLIIVFRFYAMVVSSPTPKGHHVGIASVHCGSLDRKIVVRISGDRKFFLNVEEVQDWSTLENRLSEIYAMRKGRVLYLLADEAVDYQTIADAIDAVRPLDITVKLITPDAMNAVCPAPVRRKRPLASFE